MIDLRLVREDSDLVRASQAARGEDPSTVDVLVSAAERRREAVGRADSLRAEQKALGKRVSAAAAQDRAALLARAKELAVAVKSAQADETAADLALRAAHLQVPNVVEYDVPVGGEDDYTVVKEVGDRTTFCGFTPRDHVELGQLLGAVDTERGSKVAGARFYFLTGQGALLQLALLNMAIAQAVETGFTPVITPSLVRPEVMGGTGFLGAHAAEVYRLEADDLYLVGTSEVALAGLHMGEIIDLSAGPRRYAGWSSCYRREAGSYGKDTQGIIRVHQFDKVEMFSYCEPAQARDEHDRLLAWEEQMLAKVELPYRVINIAAGDLGTSAARKYDCEAWIPSQGRYREMTSTSNCTTYQARRLNIRFRDAEGHPQVAATLNGTLATTRWIVAILENHQRRDGSVAVPAALRPYLGDREVLEPL